MADSLVPLLNPGRDHTSPQGAYRPRRVTIALPKLEHRPTRAHRRAFAAVTSGHPSVTPDDYDREIVKYAGKRYSQAGDRCGQNCVCADCGSFDCSGLCCHVSRILGIGIGCCTSFVMARMCYDEGLYLPLDIARGTKSHWAMKGSDLGRGPEPGTRDGGHVVDGRGIVDGRAETMEAMGTKWGCLIASWDGRNWSAAYRIPGVLYVPPWKVQPMFNPALDVRAILNDPGKGAWIGCSDGTVYYSGPNDSMVRGGMTVDSDDAAHFAGRTLAILHPKKRHDGTNGYSIEATSGEHYTPKGQV